MSTVSVYSVGDNMPGPIGPSGWVCPKCGRTFSPSVPMCMFCIGKPNITTMASEKDDEEKGEIVQENIE